MAKTKAIIVNTTSIASLIRGVIGDDKWKVHYVHNTIDNAKKPPNTAIILFSCGDYWARVELKTPSSGTIYYYITNHLGFVYLYFQSDFDDISSAITELNSLCS